VLKENCDLILMSKSTIYSVCVNFGLKLFVKISRNSLFFLGNVRVLVCLRPEWPQVPEVCSSLGFESALGYALGRSIGGAQCSPLRISACSCGRNRGY